MTGGVAGLNDIDEFPQGGSWCSRLFLQVWILTKLFWKEKIGSAKLTFVEIIFPAYPVLMFYILVTIDLFPFERFEFAAVDFYEPQSFITESTTIPLFLNSTLVGFGPDGNDQVLELRQEICESLFPSNADVLCDQTRLFVTEEELIEARTELSMAVFFDVDPNDSDNIIGFKIFHQSETALQFTSLGFLFPEDEDRKDDDGADIRPPTVAESLVFQGIVLFQQITNTVLLSSKGISVTPELTIQKLPDDFQIETTNFLEFVYPFFFLGSLFFNLRGMILGLGFQGEKGIREAMELKGMNRRAYWLSALLNYSLITMITGTLVVSLIFATQFYSFVSYRFVFLNFLLFSVSQTALGILIVSLGGDNIPAQRLFIFAILIFILAQAAFIIFQTVIIPQQVSNFGVRLYFLFYMVPFAHILSISTEAELLEVDLDSDLLSENFEAAYIMMLADAVIYFVLGLLIDEWRQYQKRRGNQAVDETEKKNDEKNEYGIIIENLVKQFVVPATKNKKTKSYELKTNETLISSFFGNKKKMLRAVDGLSLKVKKNEIFCLLGHNGAGKTTTFNCLIGSLPVTSGDAWVNGYHVTHDRGELRKNIGVCPQQDIVMENVKAIDQLVFQAMLSGKSRSDAIKEADDLLEKLEIGFKRNEYAEKMSGGQKRRLTLALALIGSPKVIVLDEPTTGLDPNNRRRIWKLLQELKNEHTIMMTTHSLEEADALADTIAIMSDGKLNVIGSSLELKAKYGSGYRLTCLRDRQLSAQSDSNQQETKTKEELEEMTEKLKAKIEEFVPETTVLSDAGAEIAFGLKTEFVKNFSHLFEYLETQGEKEHHLTSFGLSPTSLEDVFLNLDVKRYEEDDESKDEKDEKDEKKEGGENVAENAIFNINELEKMKTHPTLRRQFMAICIQVALSMTRSPLTYIFLILYPIGFAIAFSEVSKLLAPEEPVAVTLDLNITAFQPFPVDLDPAIQNEDAALFFRPDETNLRLFSELELISKVNAEIDFDLELDFNEFDLNFTQDFNSSIYDFLTEIQNLTNLTFLGGFEFSELEIQNVVLPADTFIIDVNLIYAQENLLSLPIMIQSLYTQILETHNAENDDRLNLNLRVVEFESIFQAEDVAVDGNYQSLPEIIDANSITGGGIAYIVAVALALQSSHFTLEMMNLRRKGVKEMLLLSGLPRWLFWAANIFCSQFIVLIPGIMIYIVFLGYGSGGASDTTAVAFLLLFFLFGLPIVLFGYCLSFLIDDEEAAPQFSAELSGILLLIPWLLTTFVFPPEKFLFFENIFTVISPGFGVYRGLALLDTSSANNAPFQIGDVFVWDNELVQIYVFLIISAMTWGIILYAIDSEILSRYKAYRNQRLIKKKMKDLEDEEQKQRGLSSEKLDDLKFSENKTQKKVEEAAEAAETNLEQVRKGILPPPISAIPADVPENELKIICKNVNKKFVMNDGTLFNAVTNASLGVQRNEIFGLLGPNGAGKTTLIKSITGLDGYVMDDGLAEICGFSTISELSKVRPLMGICPQFDALLETLTGRELLRMFARIRGVPSKNLENIVQSYLDMLNLTPKADTTTKTYSGGNKRRMSVAMSMIGSPRAIFMDEPSTGLDPATRRKLWKFLQEKSTAKFDEDGNEDGEQTDARAILLTTHSMEEADALCTNIAIMVSSSIRTIGTSQELKTRYGAGLVVVFSASLKTDREGIAELMKGIHADAVLLDDSLTNVKYFLPREGITWSHVFEGVLQAQESLQFVDFAVSQRTLEDVFIEFANLQPDEDE